MEASRCSVAKTICKEQVLRLLGTGNNYSLFDIDKIKSVFASDRDLENIVLCDLCQEEWLFHKSCLMGDEYSTIYLMSFTKDVNEASPFGSPLFIACMHGYASIVEIILKNGAVVSEPEDFEKAVLGNCNCCFYISAHKGWIVILKLLINFKREFFKEKEHCINVLKFACFGGHSVILCYCLGIFNELVKNKTALDEFIQSESLLEVCLHYHHVKLVSIIVDKGAKLTKSLILKYKDALADYLLSGIKKQKQNVIVDWRYKSLQDFSVDWIMPYSETVSELDLSHNLINILPVELPWRLSNLKKFVLKYSSLFGMAPPKDGVILCTSLEYLDLSNNEMSHIPSEIFFLQNLRFLNVENNSIQMLINSTAEWKCNKLEQLIAGGNDISEVSAQITRCNALKTICLKKNILICFIEPLKSPLNFVNFWSKTLTEISLSFNCLKEVPTFIFKLEALEILDLSNNLLKSLPHPDIWSCKHLRILNLSHNELNSDKNNQSVLFKINAAQHFNARNFGPKLNVSPHLPMVLSNSLTELYLRNINLTSVPMSVNCMKKLTKLDLSCNKELEDLPVELCGLYYLEHLMIDYNNIKDTYLRQLLTKGSSTKVILAYLRQKHSKFISYYRLQCVIIGKQFHGKTSLCKALSNCHESSNTCTNKLNVLEFKWELIARKLKQIFSRPFSDGQELIVQIIDVPENMSIDYKPIFSPGCLYLVVFDLRLHQKMDEFLCPQLFDIQAHMPNAKIIIVGTFLDCLTEGRDILEIIKTSITDKYFVKAGFPRILDIIFVSNVKEREGMNLLKSSILTAFHKFNIGLSSDHPETNGVLCRKFPVEYLELAKLIIKTRDIRRLNGMCPILSEKEFKGLIKEIKSNMLNTKEDIDLAEQFLESGRFIVHFPKCFGMLSNWYFIDVQWLGNILLEEQNFKDNNNMLCSSTISEQNLRCVLDFKISAHHGTFSIEEETRLLEAFGIIYKLFDDSYLISQQIPVECLVMNNMQQKSKKMRFTRYYRMNNVPGGFFKNLLVRLIGWFQASQHGLDVNHLRSTFKGFNSFTNISYWQKGFILESETCYLKVEVISSSIYMLGSFPFHGLFISATETEQAEDPVDLQNIFCSAIDLTNDLIDQCYPGMLDESFMNIFASCSHCQKESQNLCLIDIFTCIKVILTAKNSSNLFISCPNKPSRKIPLNCLVPDLLLCDLPSKYQLRASEVSYNDKEDILGQGGEGIVFKGVMRGMVVAVKQNDIMMNYYMKSSKCFFEEVSEELWKLKILCAFNNYRHEAVILAKLKHPCIISLLGVYAPSLTYVMELCPIESLRSVLDTRYSDIVFFIKYKICFQIISALKYFHGQKLVYKDMKPENILVWSLSKDDVIAIKLSDYGLTKRLFSSGIKGIEGTSGYQAPEIWLNKSYNEKVDIFAFAMVTYELFTGDKSFLEDSSLTANRKIQQGNRPSTASEISLQPKVHSLITRCWAQEPGERPDAQELERMLIDLSFVMLENVVPLHEHGIMGSLSVICNDQNNKNFVHMWSGRGSGRCYHLYNEIDHKFMIVNLCFPGNSVTCMSRISSNVLIIGTEDPLLEIVECNIDKIEMRKMHALPTMSVPLSMANFSEARPNYLVVGFHSGELHLYTFQNSCLQFSSSLALANKHPISLLKTISSLIWTALGTDIVIIKHSSTELQVQYVIKMPFSKKDIITNIGFYGDQVWCACGTTGLIVEIDLETLDIICTLNCEFALPGSIISSFDPLETLQNSSKKENKKMDDEFSSCENEKPSIPKYLSSRQKRSIKRSTKTKVMKREEVSHLLEIKHVSYHNGMLWVTLKNCDIILINVTRENMFDYEYGLVLNVMRSSKIKDDVAASTDHVIEIENCGRTGLVIASSHKNKILPYKKVQLSSWLSLDLETTHSYLAVHKELQIAADCSQ